MDKADETGTDGNGDAEMIQNSMPIQTRMWKGLNGEWIVEWDGVLLIYPDLYGDSYDS